MTESSGSDDRATPPENHSDADELRSASPNWKPSTGLRRSASGLFTQTEDGRGRVYFGSEPGLYIEFDLADVDEYVETGAVQVIFKPDSTVSVARPEEPGDEFEVCFHREIHRKKRRPPDTFQMRSN